MILSTLFAFSHLYNLFHVLSLWSPSFYWSPPPKTLTKENYPGNLHMRYLLNYDWVACSILQYYNMWVNTNWHIAIWHFLQDVISLLNTHMATVRVSSQSALINYKHAMKFKYFKGSLVISSCNNSLTIPYCNISPLSLTESFGPTTSIRNKTQNNAHLVHDLYQPLWSSSYPFWPVVVWCLFCLFYSFFSSL